MIAFAVCCFGETLNLHPSSKVCLHTNMCVLGTVCSLSGIWSGLYERFPFCKNDLLRNRLAMQLVSPTSAVGHSPSPAVPAVPSRGEERGWQWAGAGQGHGGGCRVEWGTWDNPLEQSVQRKRAGEGESRNALQGWCLPFRCREMEGVWEQDNVGDAGLGKNQEWSCKLQTFWNAFFKKKKKGSWEGEQQ